MSLQLIAVLVLFFIGLFLHPFSYGIWDFIYKFSIFIVITYLLYRNFQLNKIESSIGPMEISHKRQVPAEINIDNFESWSVADLIRDDDLIKQYITDQFNILASFLIPDQGWIFYYDTERILKVLKQVSFTDHKLEHVPDQIEIQGLMQIIETRNDVLIEDNLQNANYSLTYYQSTDYSAASFIGIPIPVAGTEKIFITFDSVTPEQFNHQDSQIIEKIVSGIQSTLKFRLKSISLLSKTKNNKKLLDFALKLNESNTVTTAIANLSEFVSNEFEADRLTISTLKPDSNKAVIRNVVGQTDNFTEDMEFLLDEGLTGWVIGKRKPYLIDDLEKGEYFIPRYSKQEKSNYGLRSFLGIPFSSDDKVYGAITLEHHFPEKYSEFDKIFLNEISDIFTTIFLRKNI